MANNKPKLKRSKHKKQVPAIEVRSGQREVRSLPASHLTVRTAPDGSKQLAGTAIVFQSPSDDLGGFTEFVTYDAVRKSLRRNPDVAFLWSHDTSQPLGRVSAKTLSLDLDQKGLHFVLDLPPTELGDRVYQSVFRRDVTNCSFGFKTMPGGDIWTEDESGNVIRTLTDIFVAEISAVLFPAYPATQIDARSALATCPADLRSKLSHRDDDDHDDYDCDPDLDDDCDDDEDRCDCCCESCRAGDCEECSDPECDDSSCEACPNQPVERSKGRGHSRELREAHMQLLLRRLRA